MESISSDTFDMNFDGVHEELFSMEIQTCVITGKGLEIHIVKLSNVLSFWCICLKCGQRCADESTLKLHMDIHSRDEGKHSGRISSRPKPDIRGMMMYASTGNGSTEDCGIIRKADIIGLREYDGGTEYPSHGADTVNVGAEISTAEVISTVRAVTCTTTAVAEGTKANHIGSSGESLSNVETVNRIGDVSIGDMPEDEKLNTCPGSEHTSVHTDEKPYVCTVCGEAYKRKTLLEMHHRKHRRVDVHKCEDCDKQFASAERLKVHRRIHTGEKPYVCKVCGDRFQRRSNFKLHCRRKKCKPKIQSQHPNPVWIKKETRQCEQKFPIDWQQNQDQQLINRQTVPHGERQPLECNICGLRLLRPQRYIEHMYVHTGEKPYKCTQCGEAFRVRSLLNMHSRRHTEDIYKCKVCGKQLGSSQALKLHNMIHSGEKPYVCTVCGYGFRRQWTLDCHIRKQNCGGGDHTLPDQDQQLIKRQSVPYGKRKPLKCKICGLKLFRPQRYIEHMHVHTGAKPYKCTECGQAFRVRSIYNMHCLKHKDENLYKCHECQKRFSSANALKVHKWIHTGEKPHVCKVCGHGFRRKSVLNAHFKRHTGDAYICQVCGKSFMTAQGRRNHSTIHTGQKPYLCNLCGKQFRCGNRFTIHMRIHTGEKPYACNICGKKFTQLSTLKDHSSMHEDRSVLCSRCGKSFKYRTALYAHVKKIHGETFHASTKRT